MPERKNCDQFITKIASFRYRRSSVTSGAESIVLQQMNAIVGAAHSHFSLLLPSKAFDLQSPAAHMQRKE
jgi:hypothetical protein